MKRICAFGSRVLFVAGVALLLFTAIAALTGCSAVTDPNTGKTVEKFDPAKAADITQSAAVTSTLNTILPYGLGGLVSLGVSYVLRGISQNMADAHKSTTQILGELASKSIPAAVSAAVGVLNAAPDAPPDVPAPNTPAIAIVKA